MESPRHTLLKIIPVVALIAVAAVCLFLFRGSAGTNGDGKMSVEETAESISSEGEGTGSGEGVSDNGTVSGDGASANGAESSQSPNQVHYGTSTDKEEPPSIGTGTSSEDRHGSRAELTPKAIKEAQMIDIENTPAGTIVSETAIDYENIGQYFVSYEISDAVFERIYGDDRSYKTWCTVPREDLRYIKVLYRDFDGKACVGELMVNALLADDITDIFRELFLNNYQIERMLLVDEYGADDDLSIEHNNTSAFNFRPVTGGTTPSNHAYGCAIDINPKNNPYIEIDASGNLLWYDNDVELYLDRDAADAAERHMINHNDLCYRLFAEHGWDWGGDWTNPIDYQHFEKAVYP